jgi:hypothetical protein
MNDARASNILTGAAVAAAGAIQLALMGRPVTPLVIALILAFILWLGPSTWRSTRPVVASYVTALLVQSAHLIEEYQTGFYAVFPPIFGTDPWSPRLFLMFNLAWLAVFALAVVGIVLDRRPAFLVALFLAIGGGIGNGLGHLALAVQRGGYFPGAYTGALALVAGTVLLGSLLQSRRDAALAA